MDDLDLPPTLGEIKNTIEQTCISEASGIDGLHAEIFKTAGHETMKRFHNILTSIWEDEVMPNNFHDATFVHPLQKQRQQSRL